MTDSHPPLSDLRVIDASRVLAGPFCGQILGDLGAEVIKIERPGTGDETRAWGPPFAGALSAYYLSCNRNKKAMTLDLAQEEGLELFYRLVERSDVLLENFRAASADKLGLSPDKLLAHNPKLIVCSISGFGRTGPWSDLPGYDFAIQGLSGLMAITGPVDGPPSKVGVAITDVLAGLYAAVAVLACLHARQSSSHGYTIDISLLDCAVAAQVNLAQAYLTSGQVPPRMGNAHLQIVPYQAFATQDRWVILAVGNDGQWQHFCQAAQRPDLAQDPRFTTNTLRVENRQMVVPIVEELMKTLPSAEWEKRLLAVGVPHAPVWDYAQLFQSEQAAARGLKVTVRDPAGKEMDLLGSPFHIGGTTLPTATVPPELGSGTTDILYRILKINDSEISHLREKRII